MMRWLSTLPTHSYSNEGMMDLQNRGDEDNTADMSIVESKQTENELNCENRSSGNDLNVSVIVEEKTELEYKTEKSSEMRFSTSTTSKDTGRKKNREETSSNNDAICATEARCEV